MFMQAVASLDLGGKRSQFGSCCNSVEKDNSPREPTTGTSLLGDRDIVRAVVVVVLVVVGSGAEVIKDERAP